VEKVREVCRRGRLFPIYVELKMELILSGPAPAISNTEQTLPRRADKKNIGSTKVK